MIKPYILNHDDVKFCLTPFLDIFFFLYSFPLSTSNLHPSIRFSDSEHPVVWVCRSKGTADLNRVGYLSPICFIVLGVLWMWEKDNFSSITAISRCFFAIFSENSRISF